MAPASVPHNYDAIQHSHLYTREDSSGRLRRNTIIGIVVSLTLFILLLLSFALISRLRLRREPIHVPQPGEIQTFRRWEENLSRANRERKDSRQDEEHERRSSTGSGTTLTEFRKGGLSEPPRVHTTSGQ